MEQRPLRLGDIVDDYCPRERRLTNHAIVAIVEDAIRQTRCTTCDTEHPYKDGREPVRRRRSASALDDAARGQLVPPQAAGPPSPEEVLEEVTASEPPAEAPAEPPARSSASASPPPVSEPVAAAAPQAADADAAQDDGWGWLAHRQLIRATLPRDDGDPPAPRPIPEFTMHQRPAAGRRGQGFRASNGQGRRPDGASRADGNRSGNAPNGNRAPQGGRSGRRRGHKRSR